MGYGQLVGAFEIRDGTGYLEDAVVGAGGKSLLLHGPLQEALGIGPQLAVGADLPGGHLRVGKDLFSMLFEAITLALTSGHDATANLGGAFGSRSAAQFLILDRRNFDVNVNAIEQRAGDLGHIALNHGWRAETLARFVIKKTTGARIHGCGEHEARRKTQRHGGASDGDGMVFKRLPHHLQDVARELGQLVEEKEAVVGEGNFAGARDNAAADETRVGDGVVGRAEGTLRNQARSGIEHAGDGVNLGGFQRLIESERREDGRQPLGEHGFSRARRPDHQDVVTAGGGNLKRALGCLLAADVAKIHAEMLELAEEGFRRYAKRLALNDTQQGAAQQLEDVNERGYRIDIHAADHGGFSSIGGRQNQVGNG